MRSNPRHNKTTHGHTTALKWRFRGKPCEISTCAAPPRYGNTCTCTYTFADTYLSIRIYIGTTTSVPSSPNSPHARAPLPLRACSTVGVRQRKLRRIDLADFHWTGQQTRRLPAFSVFSARVFPCVLRNGGGGRHKNTEPTCVCAFLKQL